MLLQVVAKVTSLSIVCALVFIIETVSVERRERLERWYLARLDRRLQSRQPPISVAVNVATDLAALFVQRTQTFVEPGRAGGKVRLDERMHDLMHQRAAAG